MKATNFDGSNIKFDQNYPDPKPGESLVRVKLAGICGTDLEILQGYMEYHGILGHEFVGNLRNGMVQWIIGWQILEQKNQGSMEDFQKECLVK